MWREDVFQEIEVFQYLRHIFGTMSSPTCANCTVQKVAHDKKCDFPLASQSVLNFFYVDDFRKAFPTAEEAINTMTQLVVMLKRGGFNLTKLVTNSNEVFQFKPENIVFACPFVAVNEISVLGLKWDVKDDYLSVTRGASTNSMDKFAQRKILSAVSSVNDPLGIIAPFTIRRRLILKALWFSVGQSWDTVVPQNISNSFSERYQERCDIVKVKLPHCFFRNSHSNFELHTFADASQSAFCAVVYLRSVCDGEVFVSFVVGKCRVAPMRASTIPKFWNCRNSGQHHS